MDRAGTALRGVAADLRPGQVEVVAEYVDEQAAWLDLERLERAVDRQPDRDPRDRPGPVPHAGTAAPATSSMALPIPSTIASICASVMTNGGEMWMAWPRRTRLATPCRRAAATILSGVVGSAARTSGVSATAAVSPTVRISPTVGVPVRRRTAASRIGSSCRTRATSPSRSMMSRLAMAAAAAPEWPGYVYPL